MWKQERKNRGWNYALFLPTTLSRWVLDIVYRLFRFRWNIEHHCLFLVGRWKFWPNIWHSWPHSLRWDTFLAVWGAIKWPKFLWAKRRCVWLREIYCFHEQGWLFWRWVDADCCVGYSALILFQHAICEWKHRQFRQSSPVQHTGCFRRVANTSHRAFFLKSMKLVPTDVFYDAEIAISDNMNAWNQARTLKKCTAVTRPIHVLET